MHDIVMKHHSGSVIPDSHYAPNERLRITAKLRIVFFEDILHRGNSPPVYSNNISLFRVMHSQSHRHSSIEFWTRNNMPIEKLWQWE